jgi:hypothetical protein
MSRSGQDWVPLAPSRRCLRFDIAAGGVAFAFSILLGVASVIGIFHFGDDRGGRLLFLSASIPVVAAVVVLASFVINPVPRVNVGLRRIRIRHREIAFDEITTAFTFVRGGPRRRSLILRFGTRGLTRCGVFLRDNHDFPLPENSRELLLGALRASSVSIARDPLFKERSFPRSSLLGMMDKAELISLIEADPSARQSFEGGSQPPKTFGVPPGDPRADGSPRAR